MTKNPIRWLLYLALIGIPFLVMTPLAYAIEGREGLKNVKRAFWKHSPAGE